MALSFLPLYFTSLGGSVLQYGMVVTLATLLGIPSTIAGGIIVQRRHRLRKVVIISSWLGSCILLGYYFSNSWITLSIPILIGGAASIGSTAWRQLVADTTIQENRTAQLSLYQTLTTIPSIFFPLIGGYLVHAMGTIEGFRLGMLIAFAVSPVSTILLMRFLRENNQNQQPITTPDSSLYQDHNKQERSKVTRDVIPKTPFTALKNKKLNNRSASVFHLYFKDFSNNLTSLPRVLLPLLAAYVLVIVANSTINPYLIFYTTSIAKIDTFQWGIILSCQLLFANIIRTPLGMISDKFNKRKVMLLSVVMTAPLSILLIFQSSFWGILAILLAMIATGINYGPTHEALQIELTPRQKRPALFAVYDVLSNLSRSAGIIIGALLFTESYALPFYGFTIIEGCAGAILVLVVLRQKERRTLALSQQ